MNASRVCVHVAIASQRPSPFTPNSSSLIAQTETTKGNAKLFSIPSAARRTPLALVSAICWLAPSALLAQSGNGYDLTWSTLDSGGHSSAVVNGYQLAGTIGQADAGALSGGAYVLSGGFWSDSAPIGTPCATTVDCKDDLLNDACNHASCAAAVCVYTSAVFGDVKTPPNGNVDLDDILCLLAGFSSFANCPNGDIDPCAGNGLISIDDILQVLFAFAGGDPCACTP